MRNYIDKEYNFLKVLDQKRENGRTYLYCLCTRCNNTKWIRADTVIRGEQISCGCYNAENNIFTPKDITNMVFGKLKAIRKTNFRNKNNGSVIWECVCECGNKKYAPACELIRLSVTSCGCVAKEAHKKNGERLGNLVKEFCIEGTNIRNLTSKIPKNNTSGYKGVSWDKSKNKWVAQIEFKGKHYHLGRYSNLKDAVEIRKIAEEKLFGEFLDWYNNEYKNNK